MTEASSCASRWARNRNSRRAALTSSPNATIPAIATPQIHIEKELGYVADVRNGSGVTGLAEEIDGSFGPVDILVNNAGINVRGPIGELIESRFHLICPPEGGTLHLLGSALGLLSLQRGLLPLSGASIEIIRGMP